MFTFSFSSAFAAKVDETTPVTDAYFNSLWANYQKVTDPTQDFVTFEGYKVKKATLAGFEAEAKAAYDYHVTNVDVVTTDTDFAAALESVSFDANKKAKAFRLAAVQAQFALDKAAALAKVATVDTSVYSTEEVGDTEFDFATATALKLTIKETNTYKEVVELALAAIEDVINDADDFTTDDGIGAYVTAKTTIDTAISTYLAEKAYAYGTPTDYAATGIFDLKEAYNITGDYILTDATNKWSVASIAAGKAVEDANVAAVKAQIAAEYASATNGKSASDVEKYDNWKLVADLLAEGGATYASITPASTSAYQTEAANVKKFQSEAKRAEGTKNADGTLAYDVAKMESLMNSYSIKVAKNTMTPTEALNDLLAKASLAADEYLAYAKESAHYALDKYVAYAEEEELYYPAELAKVKEIAVEASAKIDAAETQDEFEKTYKDYQKKINDVMEADELVTELSSAAREALTTLYDSAAQWVTYFNSANGETNTAVAKDDVDLDGTTLADKITDLVGNSGARTAAEIKALSGDALAIAQALPTVAATKAAKKAYKDAVKTIPASAGIADLATVKAVKDAYDAWCDLTTDTDATIDPKYGAALTQITTAYNKDFAQKYSKLDKKDKAAVKALKAEVEAVVENLEDLEAATPTYLNSLVDLLDVAIGDIKAAEREVVEKAIEALPPTPTQDDVAAVKAARELYDAYVAEWNDYTTLWENRTNSNAAAVKTALKAGYAGDDITYAYPGTDYLGLLESYEVLLGLNAEPAYANVEALKITAKSVAGKGYIKVSWTVKGENDADGYQVYKSTKANKGFKKAFTTTKKTYKNTKGLKKGTKYYYKVRAYKVVDGVTYYSDWSNKAYRTAK